MMAGLESASKYLNNLLLARGLLQHGKPIDFAHPAHGDDSTDATMAKIINLVHDLVLRRDRESERHESMAESIRNLRAAESQRVLDLQQMQDKNQRLKNDVTTMETQERALKASMKKLEIQTKELKEQNAKMKSMVDQIRAKCTSDVRKRDVEIEKLKAHLTGSQRGRKEAGGMKVNTLDLKATNANKDRRVRQDVHSPEWSLEKETNDFLAALVNETSAENVSLRQVVSDTLAVLKDMSGFEEEKEVDEDDGIGIPGQYRKSRQQDVETLKPVELLAQQMDKILGHCRTILKDPSFVPIEEVQIREEEIEKLRAGWEKMADRWKEAVTMMSQWKQRMAIEGKDTDIDEFSDLSFGRSIAIRPDGQPVLGHHNELSSIFEESRIEGSELKLQADQESEDEHTEEAESDLELEPQPAFKRIASSPARRGVRLPRIGQPLSETNNNARSHVVEIPSSKVHSSIIDSDIGNNFSNKLTIPQKLAAIETEALAAKEEQQQQATRKRKNQSTKSSTRRAGRRRSTLSPEELASIICGG